MPTVLIRAAQDSLPVPPDTCGWGDLLRGLERPPDVDIGSLQFSSPGMHVSDRTETNNLLLFEPQDLWFLPGGWCKPPWCYLIESWLHDPRLKNLRIERPTKLLLASEHRLGDKLTRTIKRPSPLHQESVEDYFQAWQSDVCNENIPDHQEERFPNFSTRFIHLAKANLVLRVGNMHAPHSKIKLQWSGMIFRDMDCLKECYYQAQNPHTKEKVW